MSADGAGVTDPAVRRQVRGLVEQLRQSGAVEEVFSYLDRGGQALVSEDGRATILPLVLAPDEEDSIEDVIEIVQRADRAEGASVDITGDFTAGRDFEEVSAEDLRKGELQFGLPAALIVLLLVFGTLVGAAIPLLMALISIIVGLGLVGVLGQFFELNLFITNMLVATIASR
jgi:RND superfamily putative drug exporter